MKPTAGIPTLYRGIQYRSRLEAKWAAMFDLLGWTHQYEPFDLQGWIPDFLVGGMVLVEVKPVACFPADVARGIERATPEQEVLILGCAFPQPREGHLGRAIGWLRATPPVWRPDLPRSWGFGLVQLFRETFAGAEIGREFGLFHSQDGRMRCDPGYLALAEPRYGHNRFNWGSQIVDETTAALSDGQVVNLWNEAGNSTQWRGQRSEVIS